MSTPCYCGSCCFLLNESVDGFGGCLLKDYESVRCSDQCDLDHTTMRTDCLLKGLHYLQKWRRGANTKQPMGYVVGKMIDSVIYKLRQSK